MRESFFRQPSVMSAQQHFSMAPSAQIQRSTFDRSHSVKTTFNAGRLIPVFVDEVLPGDTFNLDTTSFTRLATPLRPIMDNIYLDFHFFFVPNRLVFDQWQEFMGERPTPNFDPNTVSLPKMPWAVPTTVDGAQTIGRYFGLPRIREFSVDTQEVSCLPFRAYKLIYNEWYRDQNLIPPEPIATGDYDPSKDVDVIPYYRGKRHDYFTSCLPWPQKGDPVTIPFLGDAPVYGFSPTTTVDPFAFANASNIATPVNITGTGGGTTGAMDYSSADPWPTNNRMAFNPFFPIGSADMDSVTSVSVNDLRTAFQIQKMLERDARGGTRYIELILSHFGVRSDDARLQRPEYLGGGTQRMNINPLASTATVPTQAPQANLAGVGTSVVRSGFSKSFTEHGFIIGIASARADLNYQNGIERFWSRTTRYDFYWPTLAHLGEQAVLRKEIYYNGNSNDEAVFGYQERYAEYRYKPSLITGVFNSNCASSLDSWHLAQDFASQPLLNNTFIAEQPPMSRILAVPSEPQFLCDIWHDLKCTRPMPIYSVPGLIDHF